MKSNLKKLTFVILLVGLGFVLGLLSSRSAQFQKIAEAQVAFGDAFHLLHYGEISEKIRIHGYVEKDPEMAKEYLKRSIAVPYRKDPLSQFILNHEDSIELEIFTLNNMIEDFLMEHPLKECEDEPEETRLQCNLDNVLPRPKS